MSVAISRVVCSGILAFFALEGQSAATVNIADGDNLSQFIVLDGRVIGATKGGTCSDLSARIVFLIFASRGQTVNASHGSGKRLYRFM